MTDSALPRPDRPTPAAALQQAFRGVLDQHMRDVPMLNPALCVEAVGFRPWSDHWLGILVTPWFMNLLLMPRVVAKWQAIGERESRHFVFPAGVFEFIGGRDATLGDYQACSLFSPMFEFANQQEAHDTAVAALVSLFDPASREPSQVAVTRSAPAAEAGAAAAAVPGLSKRDFLFGAPPRSDRGA